MESPCRLWSHWAAATKPRKNELRKILSSCEFHYAKMSQASARRFSSSASCTNIPINCVICPQGLDHQHPTFWKYNLHHHILEFHATEARTYPPLPSRMVADICISHEEEKLLGIPEEDTSAYRAEGAPASDNPFVQEAKEATGSSRYQT